MENDKKPGLLRRLRAAFAGVDNRATTEPRHPDEQRIWFPTRTLAGVAVNEDNLLTNATAWAACRYISQSIAGLPWHAMKPAPGNGGTVAYGHRVDNLLHVRASPEWSPFQFRETLTHWALRYGNGIAELVPDQAGRPSEMWPIHPDRVEFVRYEDDTVDVYGDPIKAGALAYEIDNGTGGKVTLSAKRIFHLRGYGDGPVGVNVTAYAAQTIGWAKAAALFGAAFFGNGMNIGGVITNKVPLSLEALAKQRAAFQALRGSRNAFATVHLDADAEYKPFDSNLADAQYVELHHHLIEEVCRYFGVPPHKVGHLLRATFSNIEHQSIEVVQDTLLPWCRRWEEEADYKLFAPREGMWTKLNLAGLLRGDSKSQADALAIARQHGVISANEWRALLDMPPIADGEGGDAYLVQAAQIRLADVGKNFGANGQAAQPASS